MFLFIKRRKQIILALIFPVIIFLIHFLGITDFIFERDYDEIKNYPMNLNNLIDIINGYKLGLSNSNLLRPINYYNYDFLINPREKCSLSSSSLSTSPSFSSKKFLNEFIRLLIVVKSAVEHFDHREAIRNTWGKENRFSDVKIRTVFIVGNCPIVSKNVHNDNHYFQQQHSECQKAIISESLKYGDIIQADFADTYFNNTVKTMLAQRWILENCKQIKFILFIDDDYYLSVKNLLKFLNNPSIYCEDKYDENPLHKPNEHLANERLYAGFVFNSSWPKRIRFSKWSVSLDEYPYSRYPPYVSAGAIVFTYSALQDLYYASFYTKHFRFDDIYISILAKKVSLKPMHCYHFHFYRCNQQQLPKAIASHGFSDVNELTQLWHKQKSLGYA